MRAAAGITSAPKAAALTNGAVTPRRMYVIEAGGNATDAELHALANLYKVSLTTLCSEPKVVRR